MYIEKAILQIIYSDLFGLPLYLKNIPCQNAVFESVPGKWGPQELNLYTWLSTNDTPTGQEWSVFSTKHVRDCHPTELARAVAHQKISQQGIYPEPPT